MKGKNRINYSRKMSQEFDRKTVRSTLYAEIIQKHRRAIFAFAVFLGIIKSKKSNGNTTQQNSDPDLKGSFD